MEMAQQALVGSDNVLDQNRAIQRVTVNLPGRLMLPSHEEHDCIAQEMSPGDVHLVCAAKPSISERIIAYIEHLGRIEGVVTRYADRGFFITVQATERKRDKLAAQLTWLANKHELGLPEDRRHERLDPQVSRSELILDDGRRYPCKVIDLSMSGAAIGIEVRPAIGTAVQLGNMRGRVVRQFAEGVAIEFLTVQPRDVLDRVL
jgi:hypothetical protein